MRAFSWSDLLAHFETTLPESVRITAVQPRLDQDGRFIIGIRVEARQSADLEKFMDALEMTGSFHNVLATDEQATDDGLLEAVVEGLYVQQQAQVTTGEKPAVATTAARSSR
jgi:Tfp pilus assembly protein PilN